MRTSPFCLTICLQEEITDGVIVAGKGKIGIDTEVVAEGAVQEVVDLIVTNPEDVPVGLAAHEEIGTEMVTDVAAMVPYIYLDILK